MAEIFLASRQPKESLKAFKMVLFLNPNSKAAQNAVNKLESLTADEYDDEVFEMAKLQHLKTEMPDDKIAAGENLSSTLPLAPAQNSSRALERMLSLIDAFIVRNDLEKAHLLLKDTLLEFGSHPEIQRRMKSLQIRSGQESESASPLKPLNPAPALNREKIARENKLKTLNDILTRIDHYRANVEI